MFCFKQAETGSNTETNKMSPASEGQIGLIALVSQKNLVERH